MKTKTKEYEPYEPTTPEWGPKPAPAPKPEPAKRVRWVKVFGALALFIGCDILFYLCATGIDYSAAHDAAVKAGKEVAPYVLDPRGHPILLWVIAGLDALILGCMIFMSEEYDWTEWRK